MSQMDILPERPSVFKQWLLYALLLLSILLSAMMVVFQVFEYRHDYREMNSLQREKDDLNADWGRLLIEQQTFGATAQIGSRAVTTLRMYSPPLQQTVVIQLPNTPSKAK